MDQPPGLIIFTGECNYTPASCLGGFYCEDAPAASFAPVPGAFSAKLRVTKEAGILPLVSLPLADMQATAGPRPWG